MSSEVQGVRKWLLHLYPDIRQKSAFLKSGYALRSGVGVGLFAICHAIFLHESDRRGGNSTLLQWSQGCLWGAITVLTVNFPIMGRIAKQSFERGLGTIVGGWLGYAAYVVSQHPSAAAWQECWTAIISFLFAFAAFLIGVKLKLDYSAKLLGITFVLVLWTPQSEEQALDVAASRISCIVIAILVMAVLSVLIYPQIASELVMGELHSGMQSIADFSRIVWEEVNHTCKEESYRISRSFHLRNTALKGITDVQAGKVQHPPVARSGAATGQFMCESPHDGRGASKYSTASEHSGRGVRALSGGQQKLAGSRTDTEASGRACSAHQASVKACPRQQGSLTAQADDQDRWSHSAHNDSSSNVAASSPALVKCSSDPGARIQEGLKRNSLPQPVQGNGFMQRWQHHQQQTPAQEHALDEAMHAHADGIEQSMDREAALAQSFKGYFELDKERPFFDALGDFRSHIAKCEEHVATALSEVYVGKWAGRRWFFPTVFYQNSLRHENPGWHIPEQVLKGVRMRMQRTVRVLYMIHCTFRDGFQGEVLEELQHHYPLNLLMALSDAAVGAMQEFVDSFPRAYVSPRQLMPATALVRLNEVTNELMELARASRANKVDLILMGERYRRMLEHGVDPAQQAETDRSASGITDTACDAQELPGMRVLAEKLCDPHTTGGYEEHGLFLFPNTDAGWLATTRWYSFHFLVQQLLGALVRLRISLNLALPLLPGADIPAVPCCLDGSCPKGPRITDQDIDQHGPASHADCDKKRPTAVQIAVE